MPFHPQPGVYYRMPAMFGPTPGPRQWPGMDGPKGDPAIATTAAVKFLTRAEQLEPLLPAGFSIWGEPVVTLNVTWMERIPWLAGRGYAMSDFCFRAIYQGKGGPVHGTFVLVRWENLADPILSGRDELGHNKIYCEISALSGDNRRRQAKLSWLGHTFGELEIRDLAAGAPSPPDPLEKGQLHYKYIPRTGRPGEADAAYAVLSPYSASGGFKVVDHQVGHGEFQYRRTNWEQFPFCHHVITTIADLDVLEPRGASVTTAEAGAARPGHDTFALD